MRRLSWLLLLVAAPATAQTIVTSPVPDATSVTIYRDPDRGEGDINARFPRGFALISEKRRISLPAGESLIRFEGVADGMIAVSAVVTGLPGGVAEQNRDAKLLSPASLLDGSLGNIVHLRRTNRATGKVTEQDAVIRSGADGAVVLELAEGVEALRCDGLPERLAYTVIPADLSARPTFSLSTTTPAATSADVTLTYLATGFDWGANYVGRLSPENDRLDLFAWMTVANGSSVGFSQSQLLAVAGRLNRSSNYDALGARPTAPALYLQCWPMGTTTSGLSAPPPPPPAPMMEDIVVTAQRRTEAFMAAPVAMMAAQEDLGDLKLYRVPLRVDVNPSGQKQVALMDRHAVPIHIYYAAALWTVEVGDAGGAPMQRMLRFRNGTKEGMGVPLPAGQVALFALSGSESLLLSDSAIRDHAIGEDVEIFAGDSAQVRLAVVRRDGNNNQQRLRAQITNATPRTVTIEMKVAQTGDTKVAPARGLVRKDGAWLWRATVSANGTATLDYGSSDEAD